MEQPIQRSKSSRRSFIKISALTFFGSLVACISTVIETSEVPPTQPPASTIQPTDILPTATSDMSVAILPTVCPYDVECDQASLSGVKRNPETSILTGERNLNPNPTHIITSMCLRDGGCVEVCPVECIVPGRPQNQWPRYYIDPENCIDCGACIPECPFNAIYPEEEVPSRYLAKGGEYINRVGICGHYEGINHFGDKVVLNTVCRLKPEQEVDLTLDIQDNFDFFQRGPGYSALDL